MDAHVTARALGRLLGGWRTREPAYEALADGVRLLCLDNRLPPFTMLPAERVLASALGVSRATVSSAYRSLRDSHHIDSVRGSGSFTTPREHRDPGREQAPQDAIDFQQASPPAWSGLAGVIAEVTQEAARLVSGHGYDTIGDADLRALIAEDYARRGVPTSPANILITVGAQSALHLIGRSMIRRGDGVVVETPTYPHAAESFVEHTARVATVPVTTTGGWDLQRARDVFASVRPKLAYLMPRFQNPTAAIMLPDAEDEVARLAATHSTTLVIDDTTADLAFGPPLAPATFRGADVVRVGSLSKLVWGGLRIGWIRAEEDRIHALHAARSRQDLGTPVLEQRIAAGVFPHIDDIRSARGRQLSDGHVALVGALATSLPTWDVPSVAGGLSLWVRLDAPLSAALVLAARARGVFLTSGPRFGPHGGHDAWLRLPFTAPPTVLTDAVTRIADAWQDVRGSARAGIDVGYERMV